MCATPRLPDEVWVTIVECLPKLRALCTLSLVSRSWQLRVVPYLYRTVHLSRASHLEQLSKRFTTSDNLTLLAREHLRDLVLYHDESRTPAENSIWDAKLEPLATILSAAINLQRFVWKLPFIPNDPKVIELLQTSCPNLRSFEFDAKGDLATFSEDRYARIFDLKNLEHISLDIEQHQFLFSLNLEPFTLPLLASPNIKSIEIAFRDVFNEYRFRWSPSALFTILEGVTFPFLHTFRADGAVDAEWFQSFHTPYTDPLGDFFTRHPGIRTIGFGWTEEMDHNVIVAPQVVEDLFPSLVQLDAPAFLCVAVMASKLADQVEYIGVWDVLPSGTLHTIQPDMKRMPRLRKLVIDYSRTGLVSMDVLKQILSCAPGLEELEVTRRIDQPHQLPEAVRVVPNLRTLTFDLTRFPGVGNDAEWDAFALALAQACPKLQRVKNEDPLLYTAWDVQRGNDGEVTVSRTKAY